MKNNLKVQRARKNITQEELAATLKIRRETISRVEIGEGLPNLQTALKLAAYFGCSVEDIFQLERSDFA